MLYYILTFGPYPTRALSHRTYCPPLRAGTGRTGSSRLGLQLSLSHTLVKKNLSLSQRWASASPAHFFRGPSRAAPVHSMGRPRCLVPSSPAPAAGPSPVSGPSGSAQLRPTSPPPSDTTARRAFGPDLGGDRPTISA